MIVTGNVRADGRAPGIPGGFEIGVTGLQVVQEAAGEYPLALKEHGVEFVMDNRHLWLRMPSQWAILRVRAAVISAIRDWLDTHGFIQHGYPHPHPRRLRGHHHAVRDTLLR